MIFVHLELAEAKIGFFAAIPHASDSMEIDNARVIKFIYHII